MALSLNDVNSKKSSTKTKSTPARKKKKEAVKPWQNRDVALSEAPHIVPEEIAPEISHHLHNVLGKTFLYEKWIRLQGWIENTQLSPQVKIPIPSFFSYREKIPS